MVRIPGRDLIFCCVIGLHNKPIYSFLAKIRMVEYELKE